MTMRCRLIAAMQALVLVAVLNCPVAAAVQDAAAPAPLAAPATLNGKVFCNGVRLQDEIIVVNTRRVGCSCDPESLRTGLAFENFALIDDAGARRWQPIDLDAFLALNSSVPTIVFIHGNQIAPGDAKNEGLAVYRHLMRYGADGPPVRFVIFSWPSSRVGGLLRDVRVKATRTDPAGCQLAWLLDQMPPETSVTLVGFSYGARIITAGLHIYAGGNIGSLSLAERMHPHRAPMNVVLMSAALHAHWLGEGQYHGLAMTQVNQMLLLNNCGDIAMRFYHLAFKGRGRPQALGLRGPTRMSQAARSSIQMRDLSRYGREHELFLYVCAPGVAGQIWELSAAAPAPVLQAAR